MSALDQILAASDSDDDTHVGDIRLEDILNDDDDDEDDFEDDMQDPSSETLPTQPSVTPKVTQFPEEPSDSDSDSGNPTLEDILAANDDEDEVDDEDEANVVESGADGNRFKLQ